MGYSPCNFTLFHFFVKTFKTTTFSDRKSVSRYYFCTTNQSVVHGVSLPVLSSKRGDDRKGIGLLIWPGLQTGVQRCIASCWPINTDRDMYTFLITLSLSSTHPPLNIIPFTIGFLIDCLPYVAAIYLLSWGFRIVTNFLSLSLSLSLHKSAAYTL